MLTEKFEIDAWGPYTFEARYSRDDAEPLGVAMAVLRFQGSDVLRFHVLDEQWPRKQNPRSELGIIVPASGTVSYHEAIQWEYCRRLLYGAMQLRGQEPDSGTARLVEPMRVALARAFEEGRNEQRRQAG